MNEEKFNPNVADANTMLIVARLGDRKRKLERMAEMEHRLLTSSLKKHAFYNLLINNILYLCVT